MTGASAMKKLLISSIVIMACSLFATEIGDRIINEIKLEKVTVSEMIRQLRRQHRLNISTRNSTRELDARPKINLFMREVPVSAVIHYACAQARIEYHIDQELIILGIKLNNPERPVKAPRLLADAMMAALQTVKVDRISLENATTEEAYDKLYHEIKISKPNLKLNFVLMPCPELERVRYETEIKDMTAYNVIRYLNQAAGTEFTVEPYAIVIHPKKPEKPPDGK